MAYDAGSVVAKFKSDITGLKAGLKAGKQELTKFQQSAMQVSQKMQTIGGSMIKNITLPLAMVTGASVKFGMEFEDAMTKSVSIMSDVTPELRKQMEEVARSLAIDPTINKSAEQLAESYFYLASAGLDAVESMNALPEVARFATAGNFDMATATDLLTDAQSALGLATEDTAESLENMTNLSDVLVKANTLANASVQQFSESLTSKSATAMNNYNVALEEGVAVLAVFADRGIKGALAGEQFSRMLRYLQKNALDNAEAMEKFNVEVYDSEGNLNNLADIIGNMEGALEGMTEKQKSATLAEMGFDARLQDVILTLMGTSDQIREYQKELEDAGGITQSVAENQMQSMKEQLGQLKNLFIENALQAYEFAKPTIQDIVIPALTGLSKVTGEVLDVFNSLPRPLQTLISGFTSLLMVTGPALLIGGKLVQMFINMKVQMTAVATFIKGAGGLKMAIAGLGTTFAPFLIGGGIILGLVKIIEHFGKMKQLSKDIKGELIQVRNITEAEVALARVREEMEWIEDRGGDLGQGLGINRIRLDDNSNYQALVEQEKQLLEQIKSFEQEKREEVEKTTETVEEENEARVADSEETEEEILRKRQEFEQKYEELLFEQTHSRIEILEREKELAIQQAQQLGSETLTVRKYYDGLITEAQEEEQAERQRIAEQEAQQAEQLEQQKLDKVDSFNQQWSEKYMRASADRIEILEWEKQRAIEQAQAMGASTTNIIRYYELMKQQALKETADVSRETIEQERENTEIITEVLAEKNEQVRLAKDMYSALGETYNYNSQLLTIYRKAITELIEKGISPQSQAVTQLVKAYNELNEQMGNNIEQTDRVNEILQNAQTELQQAKVKSEAFGDSFDYTAREIGILETAINQLIAEGLTMQDEAVRSLVERYNELRGSAERAYESMKKAGGVRGASELSIEQLRQIEYDKLQDKGFWNLNEDERDLRWELYKSEREDITDQQRLDYDMGWAQASSVNNDVVINQSISDKETADYATDELVEKLQGRGVGGSFR